MSTTPPENPNSLIEFSGDITDYWSYSQIRDYVLLLPGLGHSALRLYLLLRSMIVEATRRPRGGLRRMTIDQLCWLLTDKKPVSVSSVYDLLGALERADLVLPKDQVELEGAAKLKGKAKAARGIARGFIVKDLPPTSYTGWRNAWDKLDAYRADWRENPVQSPIHTVEMVETDGHLIARVQVERPTGELFQKSGTADEQGDEAPSFQKSGTAFQKSGTAVQESGTDLSLTSEDGPLKEAPPRSSSLSSDPDVTPAPESTDREEMERETAPPKNESADAGRKSDPRNGTGVPEQRPASVDAEAARGAEVVVEAYVAAASAASVVTDRRDRAAIKRDAAELLAEYPTCTADWLAQRAAEMPARGWSDLRRHVAKCGKSMRAPQRQQLGSPRPGCPTCHGNGFPEDPETFDPILPLRPCECRTAAAVPA